ncbi:4-aminobutyrate aminotransferase-like enzyme [Bradyrhizobium japonicum]
MQGLAFTRPEHAHAAAAAAVRRKVIAECCGPHDEVLKFMPPLNIEPALLVEGLERLEEAVREILVNPSRTKAVEPRPVRAVSVPS